MENPRDIEKAQHLSASLLSLADRVDNRAHLDDVRRLEDRVRYLELGMALLMSFISVAGSAYLVYTSMSHGAE
jgi:hypothetical protein